MKRIKPIFFVLPLIILSVFLLTEKCLSHPPVANSFRAEQKKYPKVKASYDQKFEGIKKRLATLGVDSNSLQMFIRIFKEEAQLEVWVKSNKNPAYQLYQTYPICASSGTLGPKRCQGDYQVPEGFYHVSVFNPYSNFYVSLGVSYPNASDNIFGCSRDKGGAIMIHGNCVTIGCIPITDDKIQEVYVMAVEAKNAGQQNIPIHIFPARISTEKLAAIKKQYPDKIVQTFWDNLKEGYDKFETSKLVPDVTIDAKGKYLFK